MSFWWFPAKFHAEGQVYPVDLQFVGAPKLPAKVFEQSWRMRFRGDEPYHGIRELELVPAVANLHAAELAIRARGEARGLLAPPGHPLKPP